MSNYFSSVLNGICITIESFGVVFSWICTGIFIVFGWPFALLNRINDTKEHLCSANSEDSKLHVALHRRYWELTKLQAEVERLQAIVAKLLKTEDGEPAILGMTVWAKQKGMISQWKIVRMDFDGWALLKRCNPCDGPSSPEMGTKHYSSTYETVEVAARE